jgi:hypothetical protein
VKLEDDKGDYRFDLIKKLMLQNAFEEPIVLMQGKVPELILTEIKLHWNWNL